MTVLRTQLCSTAFLSTESGRGVPRDESNGPQTEYQSLSDTPPCRRRSVAGEIQRLKISDHTEHSFMSTFTHTTGAGLSHKIQLNYNSTQFLISLPSKRGSKPSPLRISNEILERPRRSSMQNPHYKDQSRISWSGKGTRACNRVFKIRDLNTTRAREFLT